jgi:hypothetical protein
MRVFLLMVLAGLGCAALGSGVGWLVGTWSPEIIALVAQPSPVAQPQRLGAALGLVSGLLLGTAAMAFGLLVEAFRVWAARGQVSREVAPNPTPHQGGPADDGSSSFHVRPA